MKPNSVIIKSVIISLIVIFSGLFCYFLSLRFSAQICDLRAGKLLQKGSHVAATDMLKKTIQIQPSDYQRQKALAGAYKQLALSKSDVKHIKQFIGKSKQHYLAAMQLNPFDADGIFNLALVESQLEEDFRLKNKKNPVSYKTRTYFDMAIRLNPNGTYYRYALIQYLHHSHQTQEIFQYVSAMTRIVPETYHLLEKEPFWPLAKNAAVKGLYQSINDNIRPLEAYQVLSDLFDRDKQWKQAVQTKEKVIALKSASGLMTIRDYIRLGQLNIRRNRYRYAVQNFLTALDLSKSRNDTLEQIYRIYEKEKCSERYVWLHMNLKQHLLDPVKTELIHARSLLDSNNHIKAKNILEELVETKKVAQAYYLLARIAQIDKNWKAMEEAILEAMVLDPANIRYIQTLYGLYWRQGQLNVLEKKLNKAIERPSSNSTWFYHTRARLHFRRKDFSKAIKDWKAAIRLVPKDAHYYAEIAESYLKLGDINKALTYYQQAIQINPRNKNYPKRLKAIKVKASEV